MLRWVSGPVPLPVVADGPVAQVSCTNAAVIVSKAPSIIPNKTRMSFSRPGQYLVLETFPGGLRFPRRERDCMRRVWSQGVRTGVAPCYKPAAEE